MKFALKKSYQFFRKHDSIFQLIPNHSKQSTHFAVGLGQQLQSCGNPNLQNDGFCQVTALTRTSTQWPPALKNLGFFGDGKLEGSMIGLHGYLGVEPKIGVDFTPKMDGENNGKPYEQMDDLGGPPLFLETPNLVTLEPFQAQVSNISPGLPSASKAGGAGIGTGAGAAGAGIGTGAGAAGAGIGTGAGAAGAGAGIAGAGAGIAGAGAGAAGAAGAAAGIGATAASGAGDEAGEGACSRAKEASCQGPQNTVPGDFVNKRKLHNCHPDGVFNRFAHTS